MKIPPFLLDSSGLTSDHGTATVRNKGQYSCTIRRQYTFYTWADTPQGEPWFKFKGSHQLGD